MAQHCQQPRSPAGPSGNAQATAVPQKTLKKKSTFFLCILAAIALFAATLPHLAWAKPTALAMPENAYATGGSMGPSWVCSSRFRESGGACIAIPIPENAYLDFFGDDLACSRPYRQQQNECVKP